jgi:fibronectin type 3 domain-containing protein
MRGMISKDLFCPPGFAAFVFVLLLAGCATTGKDPYFMKTKSDANVYVAPLPAPVTKVAVLPFKAPTELIGSSVSDMVVTELLRAKRYTLVERSQMAHVLSETELALAGLSQSKAMEVAKMLGADGVVIGTVDEYGTQAQRGKTYAVVGVSIRLVNASNGQILWSADLAKAAEDANTPLAAHARAVVHELVSGIYQNWGVQRTVAPSTERIAAGAPIAARTPSDETRASLPNEIPPPAAPAGVAASDMGLREVTLKWAAPADSSLQYRVERSQNPQGSFSAIATVSANKCEFTDRTGLCDATTYYYRLVALNRYAGTSTPSAVVESMTAPPPDPPQDIAAKAGGSREVTLTWTPPRSPGVTSYRIERALASAPSNWVSRGEVFAAQFTDGGKPGTDLQDSTWYLYRVISVNRVGVAGRSSSPVKVKTLPPPAMVKDFAAASNQVRCVPLSWSVSPEPDVIGYDIERRTGKETAFTPLMKITSRGVTNFLDGKKDPGTLRDAQIYEYRIRAFNRVGSQSEWTPPLSVTTRPPPPMPESVSARSGLPRSVEVFWSPSSDEKVVAYEVQRAKGDSDVFAAAGTVQGRNEGYFHDRNGARASEAAGRLEDSTSYRYRVRAINVAGALSDWSAEAKATTKPAPVAPTSLTATMDRPKRVELAWDVNPEEDISYYVVESAPAGSARWREVGRAREPALVHSGLDDGEQRVYRVKAVDKDTLESAWSDEASGGARPLPPPPGNVSATWDPDGARVKWNAPEDEIAEYRVYRKGFLFSTEKIATATKTETLLTPEVVGKGLTVFVTAVDAENLESKPSAAVEIKPPAQQP